MHHKHFTLTMKYFTLGMFLLHWGEKIEHYKHASQTLLSNREILHSKHVFYFRDEKTEHYKNASQTLHSNHGIHHSKHVFTSLYALYTSLYVHYTSPK